MNIIFMGTPEFAVSSLKALHEKYGVKAIFTKIDKPNARGKKINFTPVKDYALNNEIDIYQPNSVKTQETIEIMKNLNPDLIVVVAYGKIIPQDIIDIPKYGIINVHSSILPKFRGAAPINAAIVAGEKETGVTIMDIELELDAGDIIEIAKTEIDDKDNFITLHDRLKEIGAEALMVAVEKIFNGTATRTKQKHSEATFVKPFKKEDCHIDWNQENQKVYDFIRGMSPFPSVYSFTDGKLLKIIETEKYDKFYENKTPGEVVDVIKNRGFVVATKEASLIITKLKPENKSIITGSDSINGKQLKIGDILK
ncbi:MAG: methionyl-tRNA formyltransferase [Fusobacteriaceae bacterium]